MFKQDLFKICLCLTEAERQEMDKIQRHFFAAAREGNIKLLKSLVSWDSWFSKSANTCLNRIFLFSSFLENTRQTSTVQTIRATPRYIWLRIGRMNDKKKYHNMS